MTLHEAIEKVLKQIGRPMTASEIADLLNSNRWYVKGDGSKIAPSQINLRVKNYPLWFDKVGPKISRIGKMNQKPIVRKHTESNNIVDITSIVTATKKRLGSDEAYIIDLCDKVLGLQGSRQQRFDFLRGDSGHKLPVDVYYPEKKLVVEYHEFQHTGEVNLFDQRMTISGITRAEQRKKYDDLRKTEVPKNGLHLVIFDYTEFASDRRGKLHRSLGADESVVKRKLKKFL